MSWRHVLFLGGIFWIACCGLDASPPERPNILFIAVDDLNDWIGALGGHPDTRTPNIDRLAARGLLFTRAYTAAPACNPSRTALLSGIRPSSSGVYNNHQPWKPVLRDAVTLPQFFKENGYHAAGSGKIFHDRFMRSGRMTASYLDPSEFWHESLPKGPDIVPENYPVSGIRNMMFFDWGPLNIADDAMDDHRVVSWAIQQLNKHHKKPLFLACGLYRPHLPWYAPKKYFELFPLDEITLPEILDQDLADVPPIGRRIAAPETHQKVIESNNHRKAVRPVGRPWLASRRKTALEKIHTVGGGRPDSTDYGRAGDNPAGHSMQPHRFLNGHLSDSGGSVRPADQQRSGRSEPSTAPGESRCRVEATGAHHAWAQQSCRALRTLALHSLFGRDGRIVRSRGRSHGMDKSGRCP